MLRTLKLKFRVNKKQARVLSRMSYVCTKLYNIANYERREVWNNQGNIPTYADQCKSLKTNPWYKQLHSQSAQGVLKKLDEAYRSWYALRKKELKTNLPKKHQKARPPGFRPKEMMSTILYKQAGFQVHKNRVRLSLSDNLKDELGYPDQFLWLTFKSYQEPTGTPRTLELKLINGVWWGFLVELVEDVKPKFNPRPKVLAIDQGIINLAACVTSEGESLIYSGKGLLSIQRYFNKQIATVQHRVQKREGDHAWTKGLSAFYHKRSFQTHHALHALTKDIVQYCLDKGIQVIVLGKLKNIRKKKTKGNPGNQTLHAWAFQKFSQLLTYKAQAAGIRVDEVSERNTSKTCARCGKKGNRVKRGLFKCTNKKCSAYNILRNADLNGAYNILNRYLQLGIIARKVLVGTLAYPRVKRWNSHTWNSHKWKVRNQATPPLSDSKAGNIPILESHTI
ncbi:MAG: RNA-guided endonuclease InsQ/TnpB family protein [Candidatus Hermodarchaeota archaeon]